MAWLVLIVSGFMEAGWAVSAAYAAWTGIGADVTAIIGMVWLGEMVSVLKIVSIVLIVSGVVGLNLPGIGH